MKPLNTLCWRISYENSQVKESHSAGGVEIIMHAGNPSNQMAPGVFTIVQINGNTESNPPWDII